MKIQDMFDTIVMHLRWQGRKSLNQNGNCVYRGDDGDKCAVGCLIPDYLYRTSLESVSCLEIGENNEYAALKDYLLDDWDQDVDDCLCFLREMQIIHDEQEVADWELAFLEVASKYSLFPVPED